MRRRIGALVLSMTPPELARHVIDLCRAQGFEAVGIAGVEPSAYERELRQWLEGGRQGSMAWLGENLHVKADPGRLLRGSRAIVMVAAWYATRGERDAPIEPGQGRVARYARGKDYHKAFKTRLHAVCDRLRGEFVGCECRAFTDIEPMPERELAVRAGMGWVGKNTMVIDPRQGSYMVLGGFSTTLPLEAPPEQAVVRDHCGTCTRCLDACPTGCLTPYAIDASRCISYLTIERRGAIPEDLQGAIGDWAFGCDVCQEVCPHNSPRGGALPEIGGVGGEIRGVRSTLPLLEILGWTMEDRTRALPGSVIKRATLATLKRNAIVVLVNQVCGGRWAGDGGLVVARLEAIEGDVGEDGLVREAARAALERVRRARGEGGV